jgi:hypothetical protein
LGGDPPYRAMSGHAPEPTIVARRLTRRDHA